eukprot:690958-Pleurochrysis_carterae.AAC.1
MMTSWSVERARRWKALPASVAMRRRPVTVLMDRRPDAGSGAEALSGGGARTSWLKLSAKDNATGKLRGVRRGGSTALALGRRSAAVRRGGSTALELGGRSENAGVVQASMLRSGEGALALWLALPAAGCTVGCVRREDATA